MTQHSAKWRAAVTSLEFRQKMSVVSRTAHKRPEVREKERRAARAYWQDPEARLRHSKSVKAAWQDTGLRARHSKLVRTAWLDPELKARQSELVKKAWQDTEFRDRQSRSRKASWQDPEVRIRRLQGRLKILKKANKIELLSQESLLKRGIPFLTNVPISGICEADIVLPDLKIAIFCDGCYWHHCKDCGFNQPLRQQKQSSDRKHDIQLKERGWKVHRFWEHQIEANPDIVGEQISRDFGLLVYVSESICDNMRRKGG